MASKQTAVDVLRKSLVEIDAGGWVCGTVCELMTFGAKKKSDVKTMACAVGLVSLAAGHTITTRVWLKGRQVKFNYALYPADRNGKNETINRAGRKALELLYRSIPKWEGTSSLGWDGVGPEEADLSTLQDAVVDYNDAGLALKRSPAVSARAWFARALKLAEKENV